MKSPYRILLTAALLAAPALVQACAVCFSGEGNADIVKAFAIGLVVLIVPTMSILGWIVYTIIITEKARAQMDEKEKAGLL